MVVVAARFEVWLVNLDPTMGREIRKVRPCVVVSPDELNGVIGTYLVAPMTTTTRPFPSRVSVRFQGKSGQIALDQLRTVDAARLVKRLGRISPATGSQALGLLREMFGD